MFEYRISAVTGPPVARPKNSPRQTLAEPDVLLGDHLDELVDRQVLDVLRADVQRREVLAAAVSQRSYVVVSVLKGNLR